MGKAIYNNLFRILRSSAFGQKIKKAVKNNPLLRPVYNLSVQRLVDYRYPLTFNLEPTNACNLKCIMCPRNESKRAVGFIDFLLFRKIVDESRPYGGRHFVLHKDGEPLLHPRIVEMVAYIKQANPGNTAYISTNGLLLDQDKAAGLMDAGLDQLHISIGAAGAETYKKVRGGNLKALEENIKTALLIKKSKNLKKPVITLQIIRMRETLKEIAAFIDKWKSYGVEFSVSSYLNWGGVKHDSTLQAEKRIKRYPCHALWLSPSINWDAGVSICCVDWNAAELLGNLKETSLALLWQGEKIKAYRRYHLSGQYAKIPICANCNYWQETPNFWFPWQYKTDDGETQD